MIPLWKEQASTFNAPILSSTGEMFLHYRGYEAELRKENRSIAAEYQELDTWEYSPSGTVIAMPRRWYTYEDFLVREPMATKPAQKILSLSEARKIALEILHEAENRRRLERELEAEYWNKLDGEE